MCTGKSNHKRRVVAHVSPMLKPDDNTLLTDIPWPAGWYLLDAWTKAQKEVEQSRATWRGTRWRFVCPACRLERVLSDAEAGSVITVTLRDGMSEWDMSL